jgi:hypothetical protein
MEAARTEWTDRRLDELKTSMDDGFRRVDGRLDRVEGRIDALQRTMLTGFLSLATLILAAAGAMIALH